MNKLKCIVCKGKTYKSTISHGFCKRCLKTYSPAYLNFYATGYNTGYEQAIRNMVDNLRKS